MIKNNFVSAGKEYTTYANAVPAPLFRKSFDVSKKKSGAFLKIAALGFYRAFINGREITKGLLAPYISNPYHYNYFDRYDLDDYLIEGENVLAILLANGFRNDHGGQIWDFDKAPFRGAPAIALALFDGENSFEAADMKWKRSAFLYDDYRCGIVYDARLWDENDLLPGKVANESEWQMPSPIEGEPIGILKECTAEPIKVYREVKPEKILPNSTIIYKPRPDVYQGECFLTDDDFSDGYLYDFGINTAGTAKIRIKGTAGQRISVRFGELADGTVFDLHNINFQPPGFVQRCIYICKGDDVEEFEIPFTYYGYRYCHIHGITAEQATEDLITMLVAASDIPHLTSFSCSDMVVNKLFEICRNSDLSNFYYFPNDCPQREKNGWTGDASESAEHMMLLYGAEKSFSQWYESIVAAQDEKGALPGIVPTGGWGFKWGNGPAWDRALVNLPYYVYKYTGDTSLAVKGTEAMIKYLRYIASRRSEAGTLDIGLGDYCQVGRNPSKPTTPIEFTDTVISYDICQKSAFLLKLVCAPEEYVEYAKKLGAELREAARKRFLDREDMSLSGGTQTAQAFGIEYGIFDEGEQKLACDRLVKEIEIDGGTMNFGFLGSRVTFHALSKFGHEELAYKMITQTEEPSYGSIVARGFTSLPERFETKDVKVKYGSYNHHFFGDITHWFIRNILGISVNESLDDPNSVKITPCKIAAITNAEGTRKMPKGEISVSWKRDGDAVIIDVSHSGEIKVAFNTEGYEAEICDINERSIKMKFVKE